MVAKLITLAIPLYAVSVGQTTPWPPIGDWLWDFLYG